MSELETLFSTAVATNASEKGGTKRGSAISKPEIVHLVWKLTLLMHLFSLGNLNFFELSFLCFYLKHINPFILVTLNLLFDFFRGMLNYQALNLRFFKPFLIKTVSW